MIMISGYELGQFLRILLWIGVPASVLFMLISTWLQYRRRNGLSEHLVLAIEGRPAGEELEKELIASSFGEEIVDNRVEDLAPQTEDEYRENLYKGILWMKEKYEQYRDLADERYSRLKDQLTLVEKRYEDLLAAASAGQPVVAPPERPSIEAPPELQSVVAPPEQRTAAVEGQEPPGEEGITAAAAHAPMEGIALERDERTHAQELEEKFARTRQRLEEELSRLRYQLEEQVSRSRPAAGKNRRRTPAASWNSRPSIPAGNWKKNNVLSPISKVSSGPTAKR